MRFTNTTIKPMPVCFCQKNLRCVFHYCCSVWGCCGKTRIDNLQKLQNRAARLVSNSSFRVSAADLIKRLGWPTISDIILSETATIMYKSTNSLAPEYLSELFVQNSLKLICVFLSLKRQMAEIYFISWA